MWYRGVGFLPPTREFPYGEDYFRRYQELSKTEQGKTILGLRLEMVRKWVSPRDGYDVLDVGIGCGVFLESLEALGYVAWGLDVNPVAIRWLESRRRLWPEGRKAMVITFWDSLEHILNPVQFLCFHEPRWIFLSMPIYRDEEHCLSSKHFKPNEHIWFFTRDGLVRWMEELGFRCVEENMLETLVGGREDIGSFVFRRECTDGQG